MLQPSFRAVVALLLGVWQISSTAVRTFGWGAVREGAIDLRPYGRGLRALAVVALVLVALFLLGTLLGDTLRLNGPLILLENDSTATRPLLVPALAVPLTLIGLIIGWSLVLAGASRAGPWLRWPALPVYLLLALAPLAASFQVGLVGFVPLLAAVGLVAALIILYIVQPILQIGPLARWLVFLALHGALTLVAINAAATLQVRFASDLTTSMTSALVQSQFFLIVPFLVLAGLGWADFALDATGWLVDATEQRAGELVLALVLLLLLGARTVLIGASALAEPAWGAWGGAVLLVAGLLLVARLRPGVALPMPRWPLLTLAIGIPGLTLLLLTFSQIAFALVLIAPISLESTGQTNVIAALTSRATEAIGALQPLDLALLGAAIAGFGWRRGQHTVARYGLLVAWVATLSWLTRDDRPLAVLHFEYLHVDQILTPVVFGVAIFWALRRRLTRVRALGLLGIALLLAILNQTGFLDNPFSPLFGVAGVGLLVFGIVWNVVTAGGTFVNRDTPQLASSTRLLLYLGYVLLSVIVVHWAVASHNIESQITQARLNETGFLKVGVPLVYLAFVERIGQMRAAAPASAD